MPYSNRGNILFLILLAVVLFAALAYAVTSSMRGGGKNADTETIQTGAAAINQYISLLRNEVQRLMLVNDCKIENIDWRTRVYKRYNGSNAINTNVAPTTPKTGCGLFTDFGGSVTALEFNKYKDANYETQISSSTPGNLVGGHAVLRWGNRKNELTPANDIAILFVGLNQDLCRYLLNPANPPSAFPSDNMNLSSDVNGNMPSTYTASSEVIDNAVNLVGDYFAELVTSNGTTYCHLGAIIVPQ